MTEIFATETMAELCVRQGRASEAIAIYRALVDRLADAPDADGRRARWLTRLAELRGRPSGPAPGAPAPALPDLPSDQPQSESARPPGSADERTLRALETMAAQIGGEELANAPGAEQDLVEPARPPASAEIAGLGPVAAALVAAPALRLPLLIQQTVRSGQVVYAEGTDLIVLGAVNAGAQLMADGNIHVYGPLRGRAIAGVKGAQEARIFCQRLEAELVGIDARFIPAEALPGDLFGKPVQVLIEAGQCVVLRL